MGQPVSYRDKLGTLNISRGVVDTAKKVVIYGPEGIGKSTLASKFPFPIFLDVEGSTKAMQVDRVDGLTTWQALRDGAFDERPRLQNGRDRHGRLGGTPGDDPRL